MVQEMNILRCYSCCMFQVHIVKKANKWQCKICNEKQSIQHIYYQGSGQECRLQVQHLNFMKHIEEQQGSESLETSMRITEKQHKALSVIEKPVITNSKWAKYMVPKKEYNETVSSDDKSIDPLTNREKSTLNGTNTFQNDQTIDRNYLGEKLMDEKRTEVSIPCTNNVFQESTATRSTHDNENDFGHTQGGFQSSDMLYQNSNYAEDNISSMEESYLPCTTGTSTFYEHSANGSKAELINEEDHSSSPSNDYSCSLIAKKQSIVIIRKHLKRKSDGENIAPESLSDSFASASAGVMFKRSKLVDESSFRKQSLHDIVGFNRSKAGRSLDKTVEKSFCVMKSKLVLKEVNNGNNLNYDETEISKSNTKRKTIFETDCDDLDEILDF